MTKKLLAKKIRELEKNYQLMEETEDQRILEGWSTPDGTFTAANLEKSIEQDLKHNPEFQDLIWDYRNLQGQYNRVRRCYIEEPVAQK